jgi:light-regulated signal transduction histidine kinase (bacteriophytochrome)
MKARIQKAGCAFLCDREGVIVRVLRDDLGFGDRAVPGRPFVTLADPGNLEKARRFLAEIEDGCAAFDWELNVYLNGQGLVTLYFAGAEAGEGVLIVGALSRSGMTAKFYEQLMEINNEQVNALRATMKQQALQARAQMEREQELYDVTRLNNELMSMQRQLAKLNVTLKQQKADLARSNTELEQFAYAASHDLQEPLRMIRSYLGLLERRYADQLDDDAREFIAFAVDGAERMRRLIQGLLAYSRVGRKQREFHPVDCDALVTQVLSDLRLRIEETGAQVTVEALPTVWGDEVQLGQLFQNLISNALKFRDTAPPQVHIAAQAQEGRWRFAVRDNGIGIDPAQAERVFMIFQRLHTQQEYPGTGIGLATCKKIVELHGGEIGVDSAPGEGSTFFFTLPMRASAGGV